MEIELISNRKFIYRHLISFIVLSTICSIICLAFILTNNGNANVLGGLFTIAIILDIGCFIGLIIAIVKKKKTYIFKNDEIIYEEKFFSMKDKITIKTENIKSMEYYKLKWYHIIFGIVLSLLSGFGCVGTPMLCITDKNGKEYNLGYFDKKQVLDLKKLYGDLLTIK